MEGGAAVFCGNVHREWGRQACACTGAGVLPMIGSFVKGGRTAMKCRVGRNEGAGLRWKLLLEDLAVILGHRGQPRTRCPGRRRPTWRQH